MRQGKLEGIQVIRKGKFSHIFRIETRGDFFKQLCHGYPSSHWDITTNTQISIEKGPSLAYVGCFFPVPNHSSGHFRTSIIYTLFFISYTQYHAGSVVGISIANRKSHHSDHEMSQFWMAGGGQDSPIITKLALFKCAFSLIGL